MKHRSEDFMKLLPPHIQAKLLAQSPGPAISPTVRDQEESNSHSFRHDMFSPYHRPVEKDISRLDTSGIIAATPRVNPTVPRTVAIVHRVQDEDDLFFTPNSHVSGAYHQSTGTRSQQSSAAAYKNLPQIGMLNLEYISKCSSEYELLEIIKALSSDDGEQSYPTLLRSARSRLDTVRQQDEMTSPTRQGVPGPDSVRKNATDSHHNSSLLISIDEGDEAASNKENVVLSSRASRAPSPASVIDEALAESTAHGYDSRAMRVSMQVAGLSNELRQIESARNDGSLSSKVKSLESSKACAESTIKELQQILRSCQGQNSDLQRSLNDLCRQKNGVDSQLAQAREMQRLAEMRALDVEKRLSAKIVELTGLLEESQKEHIGLDERNKQLTMLLKSAQENLKSIKEERDAMVRTLADAAGYQLKDKLTKNDRDAFVAEYAMSTQSALQAMAIELKRSHNDREQAVHMCRAEQQERKKAAERIHGLERNNKILAEEIYSLSTELQQTREQADKLVQSARARSSLEWQEREGKYKQLIRTLKKTIAEEENKVSMKTYEDALAQAQAHKEAFLECERRSQVLSDEAAQLRRVLTESTDAIQNQATATNLENMMSTNRFSSNTPSAGVQKQKTLGTPSGASQLSPFDNSNSQSRSEKFYKAMQSHGLRSSLRRKLPGTVTPAQNSSRRMPLQELSC